MRTRRTAKRREPRTREVRKKLRRGLLAVAAVLDLALLFERDEAPTSMLMGAFVVLIKVAAELLAGTSGR